VYETGERKGSDQETRRRRREERRRDLLPVATAIWSRETEAIMAIRVEVIAALDPKPFRGRREHVVRERRLEEGEKM